MGRFVCKRDTSALKVEGSAFRSCRGDGQVCLHGAQHDAHGKLLLDLEEFCVSRAIICPQAQGVICCLLFDMRPGSQESHPTELPVEKKKGQSDARRTRATLLIVPHWPYDQVQGRAATMKKIPDITEQALKKALGELERSIRDTKRESRATDDRVAGMDSQRAQLADEVASANDRSDWCHVSMVTMCNYSPRLCLNDAGFISCPAGD